MIKTKPCIKTGYSKAAQLGFNYICAVEGKVWAAVMYGRVNFSVFQTCLRQASDDWIPTPCCRVFRLSLKNKEKINRLLDKIEKNFNTGVFTKRVHMKTR